MEREATAALTAAIMGPSRRLPAAPPPSDLGSVAASLAALPAYDHRHVLHRKDRRTHDARLHVIVTLTNPERYRTRPGLLGAFLARAAKENPDAVAFYVVEAAFGSRDFEIARDGLPWFIDLIQLRTDSELWHKENLINIGLQRLPPSWQYVAWIDGDVTFTQPHWVRETIEELQHHGVVQMFSDAIDLGPSGEVLTHFKSFAWCFYNDVPRAAAVGVSGLTADQLTAAGSNSSSSGGVKRTRLAVAAEAPAPKRARGVADAYAANSASSGRSDEEKEPTYWNGSGTAASAMVTTNGIRRLYWHPGFAWAATREAMETMGGLFEHNIVGGGDYTVAQALIGDIDRAIPAGVSPNYIALVQAFAARCAKLHQNIGFVRGTLTHHFHGPKVLRAYVERNALMRAELYDPLRDVHHDTQGVLCLRTEATALRRGLRRYFQRRSDDDIRTC